MKRSNPAEHTDFATELLPLISRALAVLSRSIAAVRSVAQSDGGQHCLQACRIRGDAIHRLLPRNATGVRAQRLWRYCIGRTLPAENPIVLSSASSLYRSDETVVK